MKILPLLPGMIVALSICIMAYLLISYIPIGTALLALVIGLLFSNIYHKKHLTFSPGIALARSKGLELAVVFLGFSVSLSEHKDLLHLYLMIPLTVAAGLALTYATGRALKLSASESILIAFGNSICGSAAIAASGKIIKASSEQIASALSVVNLLGLGLLVSLPIFFSENSITDLPSLAFLNGSTLQSVGHVGALGQIFSSEIAAAALSFKMWRVFLLFPASLLLTKLISKKQKASKLKTPLYLWGFLLAVIISNTSTIAFSDQLANAGKFLLCFAMAAIGISVNIKKTFLNSPRILATATISILLIFCLNLLTISILG